MALLIPEVFGRRLASPAEAKLAEAFRRELDDSAVLLHSVGLVRHRTKRWAEADFVLVCRQGVFCIEVKGGIVGRTDGVWTFTDRRGDVDTKHEGPFDQAGGAAGALQAWLSENGHRRNDGSRFQVGYAVMTPDCELGVTGPDIEPLLVNDRRHAADGLVAFVDRIGGYWQERSDSGPLSSDEIRQLREAIRPDFDASVTRTLVAGAVTDELVRYTEDQLRVLEALEENPRLVVKGAAGTGKSLLAAAEARRLASSGLRVLLVCHTSALADVLRDAIGGAVEVSTLASVMSRIVDRAGLRDEIPDATADAVYDIFLPELAARAMRADDGSVPFDALVVDEGQDLLRGEAADVLDLLVAGGFGDGTWRVFLDPNQNIFGPVRPESLALVDRGQPARFTLTENCRNTAQIAEATMLLSGASVQAHAAVSGPEVEFSDRWGASWTTRAIEQVEALAAEGLASGELVLLTHTRRGVEELLQAAPDLLGTQRSRERVLVTTVAGFKGLDSTAVVLTGLDSLDEPHLRQAAYVGASRARVYLRVVLPDSAQDSLGRRVVEYAMDKAVQATSDAVD